MNTHHDIIVKRLKIHTQALAFPLGRRVGQPGHDMARDYLLQRLQRTRLVPFFGDSFELFYQRPHPTTGKPQ